MEHIFNIAINIEDEKIIKTIEESAERQVIKMICSKVEDIIYQRSYYSRNSKPDLSPLRHIVECKVDEMLTENKNYILNEAAKILADRLFRSKAGKALLEKGSE